jgi:NTP pyrophosphatase (non-canonical NTP hydrolase)
MKILENLLLSVIEECDEISQRACKTGRFGMKEIQPGQALNNAQRLRDELCDLAAVVEMIEESGDLPRIAPAQLRAKIEAKKKKVLQYMELSRRCGTLTGYYRKAKSRRK